MKRYLLAILLVSACGGQDDVCDTTQSVTYAGEIKALFDAHCIDCHATTLAGDDRQDATEGYDYDTYEASAEGAARAAVRAQAGTMPPVAEGNAMNDAQVCRIVAWVEQGAPE